MVAAAVSPNEPNAWDRVQASGAALRRAGGGAAWVEQQTDLVEEESHR